MIGLICRVAAFDPTLCAVNRVLAAPDVGLRSHHLRAQLRHFQNRQNLSCFHLVAHIHIDFADISRDFGMNIHLLERPEIASTTANATAPTTMNLVFTAIFLFCPARAGLVKPLTPVKKERYGGEARTRYGK